MSGLAVSLVVAFGVSDDNGLCLSWYGISRWVGGGFNVRVIMPDMTIIAIGISYLGGGSINGIWRFGAVSVCF